MKLGEECKDCLGVQQFVWFNSLCDFCCLSRTSLEEEGFSIGALTVVGLAIATPLCSDSFLW